VIVLLLCVAQPVKVYSRKISSGRIHYRKISSGEIRGILKNSKGENNDLKRNV
jgi:hypothetical protein